MNVDESSACPLRGMLGYGFPVSSRASRSMSPLGWRTSVGPPPAAGLTLISINRLGLVRFGRIGPFPASFPAEWIGLILNAASCKNAVCFVLDSLTFKQLRNKTLLARNFFNFYIFYFQIYRNKYRREKVAKLDLYRQMKKLPPFQSAITRFTLLLLPPVQMAGLACYRQITRRSVPSNGWFLEKSLSSYIIYSLLRMTMYSID